MYTTLLYFFNHLTPRVRGDFNCLVPSLLVNVRVYSRGGFCTVWEDDDKRPVQSFYGADILGAEFARCRVCKVPRFEEKKNKTKTKPQQFIKSKPLKQLPRDQDEIRGLLDN